MVTDSYFILLLLGSLVGIFVVLKIALSKQKIYIHYLFIAFSSLITIYSITNLIFRYFQIIQYSNFIEYSKSIHMPLIFSSIAIFPVLFLLVSIEYLYPGKLQGRKIVVLFFLIPAITIIFAWTNKYHNLLLVNQVSLYDSTFTPRLFGYIHTVYVDVCTLLGIYFFFIAAIKKIKKDWQEAMMVIIGISIVLVNDILTFVFINILNKRIGYSSVEQFRLSIVISIAMVFYAIAILKYDFLNLVPIALKTIINNISEGFLVIDNRYRIINYNRAFDNTFAAHLDFKIGDNFLELLDDNCTMNISIEEFIKCLDQLRKRRNLISFEKLMFCEEIEKHFIVELSPIIHKKNIVGTIVLLKDITQIRHQQTVLEENNKQLNTLNNELASYMETLEELTVAKERNRMARDIHDTLGHTLMSVLKLIDVSLMKCNLEVSDTLNTARNIIAQNIQEVRQSVMGLVPAKIENMGLYQVLQSMANEFSFASGVSIICEFEGDFKKISAEQSVAIYKIYQEALTNAVRHGKASNIVIKINIEDRINIYIKDDGIGCGDIKAGLGLTGMKDRVESLGGKIEFETSEGFGIRIII